MSTKRAQCEGRPAAPLASAWHTGALIGLIVAVATTGAVLQNRGILAGTPAASSRILTIYVPMIVVQCGLVAYVCRIGRQHNVLGQLIGERWTTLRPAIIDVALALLLALMIGASEWCARTVGMTNSVSSADVRPHALVERFAWIAVAVSVGSGEEIVYRGYLRTQLTAFTRSSGAGILLQAVLFGIAHADQGTSTAARFVLYGLAFGSLAWWRRGLLAVMIGHVLIDLAAGYAGR